MYTEGYLNTFNIPSFVIVYNTHVYTISFCVICYFLYVRCTEFLHRFLHAHSHTHSHTRAHSTSPMLPNRVLRLLEFVGFSCNRNLGLTELERGSASGTFRSSLCTSFLLFYYTVAQVVMGRSCVCVCVHVLISPITSQFTTCKHYH